MTTSDAALISTSLPIYYKVLGADGEAIHGGRGKWHLPVGKHPGKWMPVISDPKLCERGYHVTTVDHLSCFLSSAKLICVAEIRGAIFDGDDKLVASEARIIKASRWDDRSARLFAADCAERVLSIFEKAHPTDDRPRRAIKAARDFANGLISADELSAAASASAAYAYASSASAAYASGASASSASVSSVSYASAASAASAAYAAYAYAAYAYAYASSASGAYAAERAWQGQRILHYLESTP